MKFLTVIFALTVILKSCDSLFANQTLSLNKFPSGYEKTEISFKFIPKLNDNNLFASFLENNSSQKCCDDVKNVLKASHQAELWALKSIKKFIFVKKINRNCLQ